MKFSTFSLQVLAALFCGSICARATEIHVNAVGDMTFDRGVRAAIAKYGRDYPFSRSLQVLANADVTFGNLETPLSLAPTLGNGVKFRSDPNNARSLEGAGFDVVSVANNHALDCGPRGLLDTLDALKSAKITAIGVTNSDTAPIQNLRGVRVAWLAFSQFAATSASTCGVQLLNETNLRREISAAKTRADVVMVSCHWGVEYQLRPTAQQRKWAKLAADCGADVVLGHHPHVWQGVQVLARRNGRKTLVAYSLGNWVFDVKAGWNPRARQTGILQIRLSKNGFLGARVLPFHIQNARPQSVDSQHSAAFYHSLQVLAGELGTSLKNGEIR